MNNYEKALKYSMKAVCIEPDNIKSIYRYCKANIHVGNLEKADQKIMKMLDM